MQLSVYESTLTPRLLCRGREEEREPGTRCSHIRQVPFITCILLCYTKITVDSVYLLKGRTAQLYSL